MTAPTAARARTRADEHDSRAALAAARIDAPGGKDQLAALLAGAAERYVVAVLGVRDLALVDEVVPASVARALRTLPRDHGADELTDHLHLAVRHEVWRRQPNAHRTVRRVLAAAALVLVVIALGAVAVSVGRSLDDSDPSASLAVVRSDATRDVGGRVVDTTAAGTVLGGRADVIVDLVVDGTTVRTTETDASGRFGLTGLAPGSYVVRLDLPPGLRLDGASDGRSTNVDLTERSEADLVLPLQRS